MQTVVDDLGQAGDSADFLDLLLLLLLYQEKVVRQLVLLEFFFFLEKPLPPGIFFGLGLFSLKLPSHIFTDNVFVLDDVGVNVFSLVLLELSLKLACQVLWNLAMLLFFQRLFDSLQVGLFSVIDILQLFDSLLFELFVSQHSVVLLL